MRSTLRYVLVMTSALVMTACQTFHHNSEATTSLALREISAQRLWHSKSGVGLNERDATLVLAHSTDKVISVDRDGLLRAVRLKDGRTVWERALKQSITAGVGSNDDVAIVVNQQAQVLAFAVTDGHPLWKAKVSSEVFALPIVNHDITLIKTIDGKLFALNTQTGEQQWFYEQEMPSLILRKDSSPLVIDDKVLVGYADGMLTAINRTTGSILWQLPVSYPQGVSPVERMIDIAANPVADAHGLYLITYQGHLTKVATHNGELLWSKRMSSMSGLALDDNNVYVSEMNGTISAHDKQTGVLVWQKDDLRKHYLTAPLRIADKLVVADNTGTIYFQDPITGQWLGRITALHEGISAPLIATDNTLVALGDHGDITAIAVKS